jgi:hypothetical protein
VIFIGAVLGGAEGAAGLGADTGVPPQAAVSKTIDHPAPIADRRTAVSTHLIFDATPESRLNFSASVDTTRAEFVLQ